MSKPQTTAKPNFRNYHIMLASGVERNVRAEDIDIKPNGTLLLHNNEELVVAYAPDQWTMVEVEQQDDKG